MNFIKLAFTLIMLSGSSNVFATIDANYSGGITQTFASFGAINVGDYDWTGTVTEDGSFTHTYSFSIAESLFDLSGAAANVGIKSVINNFRFSLSVNTKTWNSVLTDGYHSLNTTLLAGDYTLRVLGDSSGTKNDKYNMFLSVSAVPEPEQWAMMMTGLFLVGVQVTRAKKAKGSSLSFRA